VPLGDCYLELVAVVDHAEAAGSAFGRWVAAATPAGGAQPMGWAVRPSDLDAVARRLGLRIAGGSRLTGLGDVLAWRSAGVEQAAADPAMPFFIFWGPESPSPGRRRCLIPRAASRSPGLRLTGESAQLAAWLGPHRLPIVVEPGLPAVDGIVLTGDAGTILL
jgi:hypothetical protein